MRTRSIFLWVVSVWFQVAGGVAHAQTSPSASAEIKDIKELMTDIAAGHVSASSIIGIGSDAVAVVENPRSLVAALKGVGTSGNQVAIAITPARTSLFPMSLSTYAKPGAVGARLLGNTTLSYAQGTGKTSGIELDRRAISIESSITLNPDQDPVVAVGQGCKWVGPITNPLEDPNFEKANAAYMTCVESVQKALEKKWNVSRVSISAGTAWIKSDTMSNTHAGQTVAASVIYGFDHIGMKALSEGAALAVTVRHSRREPILADFAAGSIKRRSSTLAAVRLSGGTEVWRGLVEVSNARSSDTTATNEVFKHALGLDIKVAEGTWINLRAGKHRKSSGDGTETKTLLNLSFSPKANLL